MPVVEYKQLLDAGVHFGHLTRKWNPKMAPYIFMEKNGIHIIDLNKTQASLESATEAIKKIVRSGRKVMFVATKKQAKEVVAEEAKRLKMPYVTERWLGGMLTNFVTIRKSLKKLQSIEKMTKDEAIFKSLAKKERLMREREREKLDKVLGGIADQAKLPAALFVVDIKREHIAIKEAQRLNIPVFALVDTNSDPTQVDFPIPANDDAFKSISLITQIIGKAIEEALQERKREKDESKLKEEENEKREVVEEVPVPKKYEEDEEEK
ncbi:MAG: 30S ribosomal protein S2 [Thermoflexibacteraceae bacterium]|jgi:small subunit ribosomal protein S2